MEQDYNNMSIVTSNNSLPMRNHNGTEMLDEHGRVVYRGQFLATHPLRSDVKERREGNFVATYLSGDSVIRTMNAAFGHGNWSTEITSKQQVECKYSNNKWVVSYMATVKVTLLEGRNAFHEDVGCGEGSNESKLKAMDTAIKSAVTDAMKRACRHFGERLGNALYVPGSALDRAPVDNRTALRQLERREARDLFGNQDAIRARNAQEMPVPPTEQTREQEASNRQDQQAPNFPPPPSNLQRQTTPPGGTQINNETSPSQLGHGFTRASELGVMVTPGQEVVRPSATQQVVTMAGPPQQQGFAEGSPNAAANGAQYSQLNTQPSTQRSPPSNMNHQRVMKRQKVVHNPYQH